MYWSHWQLALVTIQQLHQLTAVHLKLGQHPRKTHDVGRVVQGEYLRAFNLAHQSPGVRVDANDPGQRLERRAPKRDDDLGLEPFNFFNEVRPASANLINAGYTVAWGSTPHSVTDEAWRELVFFDGLFKQLPSRADERFTLPVFFFTWRLPYEQNFRML